MSKLTKAQFKAHEEAEVVLTKDVLTEDEREFVLRHWDPSAQHVNSSTGAFFTPYDLAESFALMLGTPASVIDLCAGIGALSYALSAGRRRPRIVCVEKNPDYVRVGRKIVPDALWIEADVFDVPQMALGQFEAAIANPPFGRVAKKAGKSAPGVSGDFEFHAIAIGMALAEYGQFILPQMSAGFNYSGKPFYERQAEGKGVDFQHKHGFHFECCSIDTSFARQDWKGTAPICEVVSVERVEVETATAELPLFRTAA